MASGNVAVVRGLYAAFGRGDIPAVLGAMSPEIEWNEAENFPYADNNPYRGPQAVLEGVFARIGADWDGFAAVAEVIHDAGDTVIATGRYKGVNKKTGKPINTQMAHVWTLAGGKITGFQQYADTLATAEAMR